MHSSSIGYGFRITRLLNLKDPAHYGLFDVSGNNLQAALRQTEILVTFAAEVLRR